MKHLYLLIVSIMALQVSSLPAKVDLIIFSYHRPLQLYALLESTYKNFTGLGQVSVIWRADNERHTKAYNQVFQAFPQANSFQESKAQNFKTLVYKLTQECVEDHLMYAVDDIIVTHSVNLEQAVTEKKKHGAYGFYLRLGKNTTYCYMLRMHTGIPPFLHEDAQVVVWQFNKGKGDWSYPNSVDMTIFAKSDVLNFLAQNPSFKSPNTLEGVWAARANTSLKGIAFTHSAMVNNPCNLVNESNKGNRNNNFYTPQHLLNIFNEGKKIDIRPFQGVDNIGPHQDYHFEFIGR